MDEILVILEEVATSLAPRFKFPHYDVQDLKQEAKVFGLEALDAGKYNPAKGNLQGFLWSHIHNRLYNLKRNKFNRPDSPNQAKLNVLSPITFDSVQGVENESNMKYEGDHTDRSDYTAIVKIVDEYIYIRMRPSWLKLKNGIEMGKVEMAKILEHVREILKDKGIETDADKTREVDA